MADELNATDATQGLDAPTTDAGQQPAQEKMFPESYVKALRSEAASTRTKLKAYEDAQLTEAQRLTQRAEEADKTISALNERIVKSEIRLAAQAANLVDPDAVYALLDKSQIERDATGEPLNIANLVADLAKAKPYLVAQAATAAPSSAAMIANPARPRGDANVFTRAQIKDRAFYEANREAISAAFAAGRIVD